MTRRAFGPGRVNLIGEHTDYNGGLALPFAIARGVTVEASPAERFVVEAVDLGECDAFDAPEPVDGWRAFARGMVAELGAVAPARLTISGDVPRGAGLASSAALETALALALAGEPDDRIALAGLCSRVENTWVGARTGLLDQLAALLARPGHALRIDFRTLAIRPVPLDLRGWALVTLGSGATHAHAASGYNQRRAECQAACAALGVPTLSDATDLGALDGALARRARHVLSENARVDAAVRALASGDLPALGALLDASHASLRDDYEASVPAVEETVARLKAAGAAGARMVGGGFGGAVLALFEPGVPVPAGAIEVAPHGPARLL